jgi:predicted aminopeptidase
MDRRSKFVDAGLHTAGPLVILRARMSRPYFGAASACLALVLLGGCTSAEYYWQGIVGEVDLLRRAQPIPVVLESVTDPVIKKKLERVVAIRAYASRELALPDNASYKSYTDLNRRFVLWNVFATPALSLEPREWCFPVAGCVNYRGYFDENAAKREAAQIGAAGDDVYIGGVPAYSTLGYFSDPMLSTFIRYPDIDIARLIFHELAHQTAYAKGDTVFNESFAVAVEEEGLRRWLASQNDPALTAQFEASQQYRAGFHALVERTRERLSALYASGASNADKLVAKAEAFASMRAEYEALKRERGGYAAYDGWFAHGPNNASLAANSLYSSKVPEFAAMIAAERGDLPRFYARVKVLAALPQKERDAALVQIGTLDPHGRAAGADTSKAAAVSR